MSAARVPSNIDLRRNLSCRAAEAQPKTATQDLMILGMARNHPYKTIPVQSTRDSD